MHSECLQRGESAFLPWAELQKWQQILGVNADKGIAEESSYYFTVDAVLPLLSVSIMKAKRMLMLYIHHDALKLK